MTLQIDQESAVDQRAPAVRLARLLDQGSARPLRDTGASRVAAVTGRIHGVEVIAYCTDGAVGGGTHDAAREVGAAVPASVGAG